MPSLFLATYYPHTYIPSFLREKNKQNNTIHSLVQPRRLSGPRARDAEDYGPLQVPNLPFPTIIRIDHRIPSSYLTNSHPCIIVIVPFLPRSPNLAFILSILIFPFPHTFSTSVPYGEARHRTISSRGKDQVVSPSGPPNRSLVGASHFLLTPLLVLNPHIPPVRPVARSYNRVRPHHTSLTRVPRAFLVALHTYSLAFPCLACVELHGLSF